MYRTHDRLDFVHMIDQIPCRSNRLLLVPFHESSCDLPASCRTLTLQMVWIGHMLIKLTRMTMID